MTLTMRRPLAALVLPLALAAGGCGEVRAKLAYKDGTKHYKAEEFKRAIEEYEKALSFDPNMSEAHFYLGSSHQALYRPGKDAPENVAHLEQAIEHYKKSLENNKGKTDKDKTLKSNALGFLSAIYSEDPFKQLEPALDYAQQLTQVDPKDVKSQFLLASTYEKFNKFPEAEVIYKKVAEENPNDAKACGALAGFYNKPLWEGKSKFDEAVQILDRCASLNPNDETGYYKIATFFWDKAFRDPELNAEQKDKYADKGIEAIDKALKIKPDYIEGLIYKNLLLRVKAMATTNPRLAQTYLDQANMLRDQATELKKQVLAGGGGTNTEASPAPGGATGS
jgi:tetratricopeptide (TPR) repeat protein